MQNNTSDVKALQVLVDGLHRFHRGITTSRKYRVLKLLFIGPLQYRVRQKMLYMIFLY